MDHRYERSLWYRQGELAGGSNWGPHVDVSAPGTLIWSYSLYNGMMAKNGTSSEYKGVLEENLSKLAEELSPV